MTDPIMPRTGAESNLPAITAEGSTPVAYKGLPVMTTERLAEAFGTDAVRIRQNHSKNGERFTEGVHFFKASGADLENLRVALGDSQISSKTRSLILWTERGAMNHAKILETPEAWQVYGKLVDTYFAVKDFAAAVEAKPRKNVTIRGTGISGALIRAVTDFPDKLRRQFPHLSDNAVQAAYSQMTGIAFGTPLIPLPVLTEQFCTTTDLAAELGITVQKLSRMEGFQALKVPANGETRLSKSEHSAKQVEQFYWNATGRAAVLALLGQGEGSC